MEAELQHIPAKAVSNDVTARKNKEERKQKSGDKKTGLDKINMNVTQDTCTHLVPKLHTQGHTHTHNKLSTALPHTVTSWLTQTHCREHYFFFEDTPKEESVATQN